MSETTYLLMRWYSDGSGEVPHLEMGNAELIMGALLNAFPTGDRAEIYRIEGDDMRLIASSYRIVDKEAS